MISLIDKATTVTKADTEKLLPALPTFPHVHALLPKGVIAVLIMVMSPKSSFVSYHPCMSTKDCYKDPVILCCALRLSLNIVWKIHLRWCG